MIDGEKVIKSAEICLEHIDENDCPQECPYFEQCSKYERRVVFQPLMRDALALLKEQKTGHWIYLENCSNSGVYCSECHTKVFDNYPFQKKLSYFCPHCGTRMEGEIERR